jgi:predicted nucleic acid-binding protein
MNYLLDTNVLSETVRPHPDAGVLRWLEAAPQERLYISALTFGELRKGVSLLSEGKKRQNLLHWLEHELAGWFEGKILAVDKDVADKWGFCLAQIGRTLPAIDSLIAATALTHNLVLVTRNIKDFEGIAGLEVLNPWEG